MLLLDASAMLLQEGPGWSCSGGALGVVDKGSRLRTAGTGRVAQGERAKECQAVTSRCTLQLVGLSRSC